ncbi:MAG: DUF4345 domain-containing protein [Flavobacterium sp.]|jgi:hypothetical protein|nr:DUF4345 domain-containing protein [Flavobacterium sp.]
MKTTFLLKNLHLIISTLIVVPVAFTYGILPNKILPLFLDFKVETKDLHNVFRAIMGLYLAFSVFWILGIFKSNYWYAATLSNMLFMLGLACGRIVSLLLDGMPSLVFFVGTIGELILALYAFYQLKKIKN